MTPSLIKNFNNAHCDFNHRNVFGNRRAQEDILELDDQDDDYITHMKFECRQGRFV